MNMLDVKLYSLKEVAAILKVTERTAHTYIKSGRLKGQKIAGKWQITESNLRKFINAE